MAWVEKGTIAGPRGPQGPQGPPPRHPVEVVTELPPQPKPDTLYVVVAP